MNEYSQNTVIVAEAFADPRLFSALQMYTAPLSCLIRPVIFRVSDEDSTVLFPCHVHVMFGCGLPVKLQKRKAPLPSTIC